MDAWSPSATSYRSDRKSRSRSSSTSSFSSRNSSRSSSRTRTQARSKSGSRSRSGSRSPIVWVENDGTDGVTVAAATDTIAPAQANVSDATNSFTEAPIIEPEPQIVSSHLSVADFDGSETSDNSIEDWTPDNWERKKYSKSISGKKPKAKVSEKVPPKPKAKPGKGRKTTVPTGKKPKPQAPQPQAPQPQAPQPQPQAKSI